MSIQTENDEEIKLISIENDLTKLCEEKKHVLCEIIQTSFSQITASKSITLSYIELKELPSCPKWNVLSQKSEVLSRFFFKN